MTAQHHGFKAEVQKLLDLMIHSVYSDREVFLRELVSNAADALDKARFVGLTRDDLLAPGSAEPGIRITVDADARRIVVEDDGIGMDLDEAVDNLGTIAKSGSKAFLEQAKAEGHAPDLIGQFGVGFYAVFMVADEVTVESRSALPERGVAVRWTSKGDGSYTVEPIERDHRGTTITITLREDAAEFADAWKLQSVVKKHSNYLSWPILVDGEQANSGKAIWTKRPADVDDDEANAFYRTVAQDWRDPALRVHVNVDTPFQYAAMLFVPAERPYDLFVPRAETGPKLYARRVLITEHASELLPNWLRFVRGVVDSEDIDLNVSREMVQKTPLMRKLRDLLVKKVLKELEAFAGQETAPDKPSYADVWRSFGLLLKEGFYDATEYRDKLLPLLRFNAASHADGDGLISLAAYKAAMPEGQDTIWYLTAESRAAALASPHLEGFRKKGWDVLLLTDPVDEWLVHALTEFDGTPLKSASRGEIDLDDAEAGEKADLGGLAPYVAEVLADEVAGVRASSRLTDSACVLVDSEDGISSNMERILREANQAVPTARRTLELNPRHPLVKHLAALHDAGRDDAVEPLARLLYDNALLLDGSATDTAGIGRRMQDLMARYAERLAVPS